MVGRVGREGGHRSLAQLDAFEASVVRRLNLRVGVENFVSFGGATGSHLIDASPP